jgi:hypothetical protein
MFPPEEGGCDIPTARLRLAIAELQSSALENVEKHFQLQGTTYKQYRQYLKTAHSWSLKDIPPRPRKFDADYRSAVAPIERALYDGLAPWRTQKWYRAVYAGIFNHAERVLQCAAEFPDPRDLFGELTREEPKGRVLVLYGPQAIHIRCAKKKDYIRLFSSSPSERDRSRTESSLGTQTTKRLPSRIGGYAIVTGENCEKTLAKGSSSTETYDHELEHAANAFFVHRSTYVDPAPGPENIWERCARVGITTDLKEEFIAWSLRNTRLSKLFTGNNPLYNFVQDKKEDLQDLRLHEDMNKFEESAKHFVERTAVPAEEALSVLRQPTITTSSAVMRELLRQCPISQWPKLALQLAEYK